VVAVVVVAAIALFTVVCLLFPKVYVKLHRYLRPDELHFENERPDRERQVAMVIILAVCIIMLIEISKCGR
jgi:hypothetical protein